MSFTEDEILQKLSAYYQEKVQAQIVDITRITEGWETEVYSFTVNHGKNGHCTELILRIYPGEDALQKSQKEFYAMNQLHKMGVPVPEVFFLEVNTSYLGNPFVIMEKIKGQPMWAIITENPHRKKELLTLFCKMFVDLHSLSWRPFSNKSLDEDPYIWVNFFIKKAKTSIEKFKKSEFNPSLNWIEARVQDVPNTLSLTHGDYHPDNVLVRNDAAFIIDWGGVDVSDFRMDVAWTLLLTSTHGNPELRDMILSEYERIQGCKIEHIEYFDVLACLKRLFTISVSLTDGATKLGMRPGAEAMMRKNANHVRGVYQLLRRRTGISIPEIEQLILTLNSP
jgi:aminoglycoside phosphotransferase (APT) family kinase protein